MGTKFDISLEQAMELLNLRVGFTQKEFKSNYKKLMMNIHPDTLGNLNPITRKIIEEEARRVNIAKGIIESFLKGTFSEYNINKNNNHYKKDTEENEIGIKKRKIMEVQKKYMKINIILAMIIIIAIVIIVLDLRNQNNIIKL